MPVESFGLQRQPFDNSSQFDSFANNGPHLEALRFLRGLLDDERGAGWIHGPDSSGKSTLAVRFLKEAQNDMAVALVDGEGLYASQMLSRVLEQFGYNVSLNSSDELLNMLNVFLVQQTRSRCPPLLIIDNVHRMYPGALNALCKLAALRARDRYALRLVLLSRGDCQRIIRSPSMRPVAERLCGDLELRPLTCRESGQYLYTKLRDAGARQPDDLFPADICDALHEASGGWPGKLDNIAAAVIDQAESLPIRLKYIEHPDLQTESDDAPRLVVTRSGTTLQDLQLVASRVLIGRSDLSDILVDDHFISKQHALLIWNGDSVVLVDLNSSNGTYVNSVRVGSRVLRNNDIISLGNHRIKMVYEKAGTRTDFDDADLADTAMMKNIAQARRDQSVRQLPLKAVR